MEFSKNTNIEPIGRKQRERYHAAHTVISFLTERYPIHEVEPSPIPGAIGSCALFIEGTPIQQQQFDLYRCANTFDEIAKMSDT